MDDTTNQTPNPWGNATTHNTTLPNSTFVYESPLSPLVDKVLNIIIIIILFLTMISLGCTMEIPKIKAHFLKPKGVAIAVVSQYGFMPLAAFLLGKVFQLDSIEALTVLICGCCPGGSLSNFFALAMQGDMNLSIVMTSCSVLLALGMMPLLLYLYSQGIPNIESMVPYAGIILSLVMTLVPCAIGIAINHRVPRYSPIIIKVGMSILLIAGAAFVLLAGISIGDTLLRILSPRLLITASLMPISGFLFGYTMSTIFRLNGKCKRTVGVETGFQNAQICFTILKVAFPLEVIGPLFLFPFIFSLFQTVEFLVLVIIFRCYKWFKPPAKEKEVYQTVDLKAEESTIEVPQEQSHWPSPDPHT
ncbi:hepatic sodium/bile acid cotransporter-like [Conger conger]|uniref:hepatic sodium/bile acid cotransporter-like n=1 Tax=Conger conger TaxID=82655 RepID=UPI002A59A276|nr:hepatic sodium/bile acid cotransporter-like [Conger conger]